MPQDNKADIDDTQENDKAPTPHQHPDLPAAGARPREQRQVLRGAATAVLKGRSTEEESVVPITSPSMHPWAKPHWLSGLTQAAGDRVSPVGTREARRKWAFVCLLMQNRLGGRRSTGEGAAAASVPSLQSIWC